jgi:hypothetical protein
MFLQEKKQFSDAVGTMMCRITDAVGNFVQEVGAIRTQTARTPHTADATPSSSGLRRSKRRRSTAHEEPQEDEDSDYAETEDELGDDDEETKLEDEEEDEDGSGEEDEASEGDDEDEEDGEKEEEGPVKEPSPKHRKTENQNVGSSRAALHPISEDNEVDAGHFDWDRPGNSAHWDDHDAADNTPLSVRLRQLREVIEPAPLEVILPPTAKDRRARLSLPKTPKEPRDPPMNSSSAAASSHKRSKSADDSCRDERNQSQLQGEIQWISHHQK